MTANEVWDALNALSDEELKELPGFTVVDCSGNNEVWSGGSFERADEDRYDEGNGEFAPEDEENNPDGDVYTPLYHEGDLIVTFS